MIGVSILGWNVWKGVLLFLCVSLCIAGFSAFFSGDTRSLLPSVMFLALTLFMLRKPLASLFLRLKWKFPRPSPTRPLAVKSQKVKQSKTFPAPSEEPSHIQVYTKKIDPEENLSLTGAKLTYSDAEALRYWNGKPTVRPLAAMPVRPCAAFWLEGFLPQEISEKASNKRRYRS